MTTQSTVAAPAERAAESTGAGRRRLQDVLFGTTAFFGAALLFVVQPLVAKLLLASYGGSATVWSTSSLFFQTLLLLGYLYVHWSTTRLGPRWQPRLHLPFLALPVLALPLLLPEDAAPPDDAMPALWLLRTLVTLVGLPFIVVATTGPVLQRWYSWTHSERADDPYFLFAASNLGSFVGLLAYPFVIEPLVPVRVQLDLWSGGFVAFAALTFACWAVVHTDYRPATRPGRFEVSSKTVTTTSPIERRQILRWTALAFLPSTMMLGVTAHLSTDVAAIPLLWVVPLAVYLATFVLAFRSTSRAFPLRATQAAVATTFVAAVAAFISGVVPVLLLVAINLSMLGCVAFASHARLAAERPAPQRLTVFYLVISVGGALGGLLNGLVAPAVFDRVLEYPLALIAVPLLMIGATADRPGTWLERQWRANRVRAVLVAASLALFGASFGVVPWHLVPLPALAAFMMAALGLGWWFARVPYAVSLALVLIFGGAGLEAANSSVSQSRTFFGSYRVEVAEGSHRLIHGTTLHGTQFRGADRTRATTYYSRHGALGSLLAGDIGSRLEHIGVVGLGVGTIAAWGRPGQTMTFYEIDPGIVEIARDPEMFSYLSDSEAEIRIVVGDGRIKVADAPVGSFDLLVLDAFSSDSIPVHLLTREAFEAYASRLTEDGLLMVHISNRVFDLEPVVQAASQELGLDVLVGTSEASHDGATPSTWMALTRDEADTRALLADSRWREPPPSDAAVWTDDYSSVLSALR